MPADHTTGVRNLSAAAAALAGVLSLSGDPVAAAPPQRLASVNLCADQLLLALAPARRIVALGPFSRDPAISFFAHRATVHPRLSGRSEELIELAVDAVMVGPFDNRLLRSTLERLGRQVIAVDRWTRIADVRSGVRHVARKIGEPGGGENLVAEIDQALQGLRDLAARPAARRSFLFVHRRGYVGEGGVVSELLELGGLTDLSKGSSPRFLDVETIIKMRPDILVVAEAKIKAEDRGLELLRHPALDRLYPPGRRITAPDRLTICSGPSTPALVQHLRAQLLDQRRGE